ncbi:MAG: heavy-metal-associated domain-containing protein [Alphaproteobacteria bacterium]|nr:heavy-metal-associated domain-containing protein [Alphaproteobacteria bacterium]
MTSDTNQKGRPATVLSVSGMTCEGCANAVTRVLTKVPGVDAANVDIATGRASVTGTARTEDLIAAVMAAGYGAKLATTDAAA